MCRGRRRPAGQTKKDKNFSDEVESENEEEYWRGSQADKDENARKNRRGQRRMSSTGENAFGKHCKTARRSKARIQVAVEGSVAIKHKTLFGMSGRDEEGLENWMEKM